MLRENGAEYSQALPDIVIAGDCMALWGQEWSSQGPERSQVLL